MYLTPSLILIMVTINRIFIIITINKNLVIVNVMEWKMGSPEANSMMIVE